MTRLVGLIVSLPLFLLICGFGFMPKQSIGFVFHNDSGAEVYRKEIITDKNIYVDHHHGFDIGLKDKASNGEVSFFFDRAPEFLLVRWKVSLDSPYSEARVDLSKSIKSNFEGTLFFSLLPNGEVEVSKVGKDHTGKEICSGYIFTKLRYVAEDNYNRLVSEGFDPGDEYWCNQFSFLNYKRRIRLDAEADRSNETQ